MKLQNSNLINMRRRKAPSLKVRASATESTIYLYDDIGDWGISASDFAKTLMALDSPIIHLRINSNGGDVFEARAMVSAISEHPSKIIAHVDGLAASAASYVAIACDEVEITDGAMIMVHKPHSFISGTAPELIAHASILDKVEESMIADYAAKTGLSVEELGEMLAAETWLSANEAVEKGFADRISSQNSEENVTQETETLTAKATRSLIAAKLKLANLGGN